MSHASLCPDAETLSGFALGTLPPEIAEDIEEHIENCPKCESTLNSFDGSRDRIVSALQKKPPVVPGTTTPVMSARVGAPPAAPVPVSQGQELGNYILLEQIGIGGMGQVFKARHRRMDRIVALKVLPTSVMQEARSLARFEREVKAVARLSHPNIVAAHDADQAGDVHFLVMEFVEGSDLSALVKKKGPLSAELAVNYILQAARGLEAAHAEGIVHRDIKPSNLLLDTKGTIKILDMGLARQHGEIDDHSELTATGVVMGTVDYMAPEQALDAKNADARADIYGLGCSLFYLLTGKATYGGHTIAAKLLAHQAQSIPALRSVRTDVPERLEAIFNRMIAKKVDDRYQSMTDLIADLHQFETTLKLLKGHPEEMPDLTVTRKGGSTALDKLVRSGPPVASGRGIAPHQRLRIGGGMAGLAVLLAGLIISLKTREGTLIVEVNEPGVDVQVLNEQGKVEIHRKGEEGPITISVDPGTHRLIVRKVGFEVVAEGFEIATGGKKTITAKLVPLHAKPIAAAVASRPPSGNPVAFPQWMNDIAALPAEQQVAAVAKKLVELNPGFDGKVHHTLEEGAVNGLQFLTENVSNISPVRALPSLKILECYASPGKGLLADLSPLQGMKLTALNCSGTLVTDLSPLEGMPLTSLICHSMPLRDLSPLQGMPLQTLYCHDTQVSDLTPLKNAKLVDFSCGGTKVSDLSPLNRMKLTNLNLHRSMISDLSPVRGMPLTVVWCDRSRITDLSPLKDSPLKELRCDFTPDRDADVIRAFKSLEKINGRSPADFWKNANAQSKP